MQDNYVYMQDIYIYMQDKYIYMQNNYVYIITQYFQTVEIFSCNWKIYEVMSLQCHRRSQSQRLLVVSQCGFSKYNTVNMGVFILIAT